MSFDKEFYTNRETWNNKVSSHAESEFYDLEGFKRGNSSLNVFELKALGDVSGKSFLHLQCHFGQDTMSWSRMGAKCTGVDFSEKAIELARELALELNLDTKFVCCNVLETSKNVQEQFDFVFTSYGTIGWLPDLMPWAKVVSERLKPGGRFYIVDFHPIAWMYDYRSDPPQLKYGYNQEEAIYEEYEGTYANNEAPVKSKEYGWNHGLGSIINALISAGLVLDVVEEYNSSPYNIFPGLVEREDGLFENQKNLFPLLYEIQAHKSL